MVLSVVLFVRCFAKIREGELVIVRVASVGNDPLG